MKYENKKKLRKELRFTKEVFPLKDKINWETMIKQINDDYIQDKINVKDKIVDASIIDNDKKINMEKEIKDKIKELKKELDDPDEKPTEIRKELIKDELRELNGKLLSLSGLETHKKELQKDKIKLRKENNKFSDNNLSR